RDVEAVLDLVIRADLANDVGLCADRLREHCRHDELLASMLPPEQGFQRERRAGDSTEENGPSARLARCVRNGVYLIASPSHPRRRSCAKVALAPAVGSRRAAR